MNGPDQTRRHWHARLTSPRTGIISKRRMALDLSYSLADQEFFHTKSLGVWNVSTQLLGHLARHPEIARLTVFTNHTHTNLPPFGAKATFEQHNAAVSRRWGRGWGRVWWDQWGVYSAAKRSGNSWLFLPKGFSPIYRKCPVRLAAYVHDAMHEHYLTHRKAYNRSPLAREAGYFLRSLRATLNTAEVIFTNTDFTRSEVLRLARQWQLPEPNVVTAGIGFEVFNPRHNGHAQRKRIVVLAGPWPHKCTPLAVEWMQRWVGLRAFAGGVDWIGALPPHTTIAPRPGWIHHPRLSQNDYEQVLGHAAVVVYFSAYEGFGMPPVEGTLAGAAAVYSALPAMREVMNGCGYSFNNDSFEEFAHRMDAALQTPATQLAEWQKLLSSRHAWPLVADRIATQLLARQPAPTGAKTISLAPPAPAPPSVTTQATARAALKLAVFAHTPPPHHGQSYMVKLMLDGFGGDQRGRQTPSVPEFGIACLHINARFSQQLEDIGDFQLRKIVLVFWYCLQAMWCRCRYGAKTLYYVPAPGKISALTRDWMVLAICRLFYPRLILHWHAAGMAEWLDKQSRRSIPWLTQRLLGRADLSIVLTEYNRADATRLQPRRLCIVGNGIPDPCPDFAESVLPRRLARFNARKKLAAGETLAAADISDTDAEPDVFKILFLAHCIREKGLFDTLDGIARAAEKLRSIHSSIRLHLTVAGEFMNQAEETEFAKRIRQSDLLNPDGTALVNYVGFVSGERKQDVFLQADCFCFPTYYYAESFGLVLVEAMAFGVPVIASRWRSVPELLPADYNALVDPHSPEQIADAILRIMLTQSGRKVRDIFVQRYRLDKHLANLAEAIHSLDARAS